MKLLIAEDDTSIRSIIALTVPEGWTVVEARDGLEAISFARRHRPDAIVLDHDMPVVTGVEVCRTLADEPWRTRCTVVALTAHDDDEVRRSMTAAGCDAFLVKPFSPLELLHLLDARVADRA